MPYNPGITARGELMGQGLGAGLSSMAQSYGRGLELQEEQKRYDEQQKRYNKQEKQRKKDRRFIEDSNIKRAGILAEQIFDDEGTVTAFKETIEGWEAADVAGWLAGQTESMKVQAQQGTIALQSLQLKELESEMAQDPVMRDAMADMTMYQTEQNQSPMDALNSTVQQNPDLSWQNRLKLNQLVQGRQTMAYNAQSLQLKTAAQEIDQINAKTNAANAATNADIAAQKRTEYTAGQARRQAGVQTHQIPGVGGSVVVQYPSGSGTRSEIVSTEADDQDLDDPQTIRQGQAITKQAETAYAEADQIATGGGEEAKEIRGGDERTIFGRSRYDRLAKQFSALRQKNSQYRATTGKDHPQYTAFLERMAPLVQHMRDQGRDPDDIKGILQSIGFKMTINQMVAEGRDVDAKELAAKFGIDLTQ